MSTTETPVNADLDELAGQVGDALDLAVAAGAPFDLLERLAAAAGLLRALREVPNHTLVPKVVSRAGAALEAWERWHKREARHIAG